MSLSNHNFVGSTHHYLENWCLRICVLEVFEVPECHTSINIVKNLKSIPKFRNIAK